MSEEAKSETGSDFIREIVSRDMETDKHSGTVRTRFPPEPNGYLHIGHAKSICLNFGIAAEANGECHLRYDDTNPSTEDVEYVDSIRNDVRWLGWDWGENEFYASDYFEQMYLYAVKLIKKGKAYVCTLSPEEFKEYRGIPTKPGKESPWRNRPIDENLDLFERMKKGEFQDGEYVLRAKIDMASPNIHMRDPAIYSIKHASHHRTLDKWCIYPMYDFAHCIEDSIERITHSICTLEFEVHRPLYDWILNELEVECHPQQIEFARLNLTYTVMSKRKLLELVKNQYVVGWDDPRLPTISGLRRRGYTPEAIREFCRRVGVTKFNSYTEIELLEYCVREDLNKHALRVMGVLDPLKIVIENYPDGKTEMLDAVNNPEDPSAGIRKVPFSRELYVDSDDFMENPPKKFFRLTPGNEVRLRYAYFIKCHKIIKDMKTGKVIELRCTYDPDTLGGQAPDGRKVKGTIHWVSAKHCLDVEARMYDRLLTQERLDEVDENKDFKDYLNPKSMQVIRCKVEPSLAETKAGAHYQFERKGYFFVDPVDSKPGTPVFNQTVSLKDAWAKIQKKGS